MSCQRIERIISLLGWLGDGTHVNADDLAKELDVSRRTVFRDLKALRTAGVSIRIDQADNAYKLHQTNYRVGSLSDEDLLELLTHAQASVLPTNSKQQKQVDRAIRQLGRTLPKDSQDTLRGRTTTMFSNHGIESGQEIRERIDTLLGAIVDNRLIKLRLVAEASHSEEVCELAPLRIDFRVGSWVLDGVCLQDHLTMRIALDLIGDIEVAREPAPLRLANHKREWTKPDITVRRHLKPDDDA